MAIFIRRSPFNFFDNFIGESYRQIALEMDRLRESMFQLLPPEFPVDIMTVPGEIEVEPNVPIVDEGGIRKMRMQFNVRNYAPEEVQIKVLNGNVLQVRAEHEEATESGDSRRRLYIRQYRLPDGIDVENLTPILTKDGVLSVEAPAPTLAPSERLVPIQYKPSDDAPAGEVQPNKE